MFKKYLTLAGVFSPPLVYGRLLLYFTGAYAVAGGNLNLGNYVLGLFALAAWLINASALDIYAKYEIDQRRGVGDSEGLIVLGVLRASHVQVIIIASALGALTFIAAYGFLAPLLILVMLGISYVSASPQLLIAHRPRVATALLPLGYVVLPLLLGSLAAAKYPSLLLLALIVACYGQFAISVSSSLK